jgi:hypothetical protein|tara:strand:+ start:1043 stop:1186 length:144 start_codon:yes stop_codon:yes gene_type:complete
MGIIINGIPLNNKYIKHEKPNEKAIGNLKNKQTIKHINRIQIISLNF